MMPTKKMSAAVAWSGSCGRMKEGTPTEASTLMEMC